jgi:hypothetical protein
VPDGPAVGTGEAVGAGVGVTRKDGLGVTDSTGPGVSSDEQLYAAVVPLSRKRTTTSTPRTAAPEMMSVRYFSSGPC